MTVKLCFLVSLTMSFQTAQCKLCENPKNVTAEDKHWLIHLAGHKDDIIKYLTNHFDYCPICENRAFSSKTEQQDHFRWFHTRKFLIEWYFRKFINKKN